MDVVTLNDSQQNDDHEEEESNVEHYTINLVIVAIGLADLVAYTATGSHAFV